MLVIYLACALIGGVFVALSVSGGFEGFDFDTEADFEMDADVDAEADFDDIDFGTNQGKREKKYNPWLGNPSQQQTLWLTIFSFKFWTFGICFFGLTGLALTWLQPNLGVVLIALIAVVMGLTIGTAMAWLLRVLGGNYTNSFTRTDDLVGVIGTVEIPFDANSRGKVQLSVKGSRVGFSAMTEQDRQFQQGEEVLVVSCQENRVWVVSTDNLKDQ
ncbi:hypothetical protein PCC7418_0456 [Halothece sp. PCC 7418]|uniref:OB-fold-containig protein n=1 Tax=Halothece sp. (strain PCC 7418) TaxID=65093 RepID=UPI0002A08388|nr:OB-fold-containig protein [Halothece sp. PCC 7418]AFZ42686.1 hypothetical protein PCC7418_0456 [Halothece sp. PCC 7418]